MNKDQFWRIIEDAREASDGFGGWHAMYEPLFDALSKLEAPEILHWQAIFDEYHVMTYKAGLWGAAALMMNGCTDNGFLAFGVWLILQGKETYINAVTDADSLAGLKTAGVIARNSRKPERPPGSGFLEGDDIKELMLVACDAYDEKPGNAGFFDALAAYPLSEREESEINGEIVFTGYGEIESDGFKVPWERVSAALPGLCPGLFRLFREGRE